ncbi:hypothetical protein Tco_1149820 [Tanacetum coccineum]
MVRMKLMGLNIKVTSNVLEAASIWNLYIKKGAYYRRMVDEIGKDWVNWFQDGTGFWKCNYCFVLFMDDTSGSDGWLGRGQFAASVLSAMVMFWGSDWSRFSDDSSLLVSCSYPLKLFM